MWPTEEARHAKNCSYRTSTLFERDLFELEFSVQCSKFKKYKMAEMVQYAVSAVPSVFVKLGFK